MSRSSRERARYAAKIHAYERTPAWRIRSRRFRDQHGPVCDACRVVTDRRNPLHAHHRTYARAFTGREPDRDLNGLCGRCHAQVHYVARRGVPLERATDKVIAAYRRHRQPWWRKLVRYLTGL